MRQIGHRALGQPSLLPSTEALRSAGIHQRTGLALAAIATTGLIKGIYRLASHEGSRQMPDNAPGGMKRAKSGGRTPDKQPPGPPVSKIGSYGCALDNHNVDYLLIDGYALYALGYQRGTTDIDVILRPTREQGERVKRALLLLPDQVAVDLMAEWFTAGEHR